MRIKISKSTRRKALHCRRFMRTKMLSFLFAYVYFVFFMLFFLQTFSCAFKTVLCFLCLRWDCLFYLFISDFLPLRRFYARLRLFLFLFAYVLFGLVRFFYERYKTSPIPSFTRLLLTNKMHELQFKNTSWKLKCELKITTRKQP